MDIVNAFNSELNRKDFIAGLPPGTNSKFDGDILIPVVINTKQLTSMSDIQKQFTRGNQSHQYLTAMWRHATDANNGPRKYIITSLWALKHDAKLLKRLKVPFPVMLKWYNDEEDRRLIEEFVKIRKFNISDIKKYIHYQNVYLTDTSAYVLHYKGQI